MKQAHILIAVSSSGSTFRFSQAAHFEDGRWESRNGQVFCAKTGLALAEIYQLDEALPGSNSGSMILPFCAR
jgi:hypothetical protein